MANDRNWSRTVVIEVSHWSLTLTCWLVFYVSIVKMIKVLFATFQVKRYFVNYFTFLAEPKKLNFSK